jgi:hypothetical protein
MPFTTANFVGEGQQIEYDGTIEYILAHISDVTYSGSKVDTADNTDASAVDGYRTFLPALKDAGDCTVKAFWYPGEPSQEGLETIKGEIVTWTHTLPQSLGTLTFSGMVTSTDHSAPLDKAAELTVKIKISGPVTYSHS